jgi:hypothetical protein
VDPLLSVDLAAQATSRLPLSRALHRLHRLAGSDSALNQRRPSQPMRLGPQRLQAALVCLVSLHRLEVPARAVGCLAPSQRKPRTLPAGRSSEWSGGVALGEAEP